MQRCVFLCSEALYDRWPYTSGCVQSLLLPLGRGPKILIALMNIFFNPANTVSRCIKRKEMERDGKRWGVLSTLALMSCPKKHFEALLYRAIQRGQSARAAARHEATKRLCSVFHFFCAGFLFCSVSFYFYEVVNSFQKA